MDVGVAIKRLQIQVTAVPSHGQVVHTYASVAERYNLLLDESR